MRGESEIREQLAAVPGMLDRLLAWEARYRERDARDGPDRASFIDDVRRMGIVQVCLTALPERQAALAWVLEEEPGPHITRPEPLDQAIGQVLEALGPRSGENEDARENRLTAALQQLQTARLQWEQEIGTAALSDDALYFEGGAWVPT